jgi:hypothetical protein
MRIEAEARFIKEEDRGIPDFEHRQTQPLAEAPGKLSGRGVGMRDQPPIVE